jgi:hypothetical protein
MVQEAFGPGHQVGHKLRRLFWQIEAETIRSFSGGWIRSADG